MKDDVVDRPPSGSPSLLSADRLAYLAVLGGALAQAVQAISPESRVGPAQDSWYWIAVPLMLLAIYTLASGLVLRRRLDRLGDFEAAVRSTKR